MRAVFFGAPPSSPPLAPLIKQRKENLYLGAFVRFRLPIDLVFDRTKLRPVAETVTRLPSRVHRWMLRRVNDAFVSFPSPARDVGVLEQKGAR